MTNRWTMPHESAPQERVWMSFPPLSDGFGHTDEEALAARTAWVAVAHAVLEFEPVTMLADPRDADLARTMLDDGVEILEVPLDDAWLRDSGPTFVHNDAGEVGAIGWVFNAWGENTGTAWAKDAKLGAFVAEHAGVAFVPSDLVNEGGAIHVDGQGTLLLTETVQMDRFRNPSWSRESIENEFRRTLGAERFIWMPRGLHRDYRPGYGTRGHVDIVASSPLPNTLLVHRQLNPLHPDFHLYDVIRARIDESTAPNGEPWTVIDVPAPDTITDDFGWVDFSYLNHLIVNGGVIACRFDDPRDEEAAEILASVYPGRKVVGVDARDIFEYGGGVHCITQQQPAPKVA